MLFSYLLFVYNHKSVKSIIINFQYFSCLKDFMNIFVIVLDELEAGAFDQQAFMDVILGQSPFFVWEALL